MTSLDYSRIADLYDSYCIFDLDIPFFLDAVAQVDGPILELMAGTGRISVPLLEHHAPLVCIDREPSMLKILAGKTAPAARDVRLICADVCAMPLQGPFPLVILPFQGFSELIHDAEQRAVLREVHRLLGTGGRFICTLHNPSTRLRTIDGGWHEVGCFVHPESMEAFVVRIRAAFDQRSRTARGAQEIRRLDSTGKCLETRTLSLQCALPEPDRLRELAISAGYEIEALYGDYGKAPFDESCSPNVILVLRRAA